MALVTPIVNDIPAFDATEATEITFIANGGDQIVKNEIQIINNATNVVVYSNIETTYTLGQIIPANTLTNGNYYKVTFRTYDISDNTSDWSNYQPFYCYSLPTLSFNISDGQTIYTPNLDLTLTYNQTENERLESVVIYYYDANNNLISTSGKLFNSNTPPVVFEYPLKNFENNKTYRIQANGTTVNGTPITTGLISFHTNYETIENGSELYLTMDSCNGYINIRSAPVISALEGENESNPETLSYIEKEDDVMVDLTSVVGELDNENTYSSWIRWYDITPVSNAFLFRLWFYPARTSFKVAEMVSTDENNRITITFNRGRTEDYLCIRTTDGTQIDKGLGVICNGNTKVFLWLKVISSTWEVRTEILENPTTIFDWNNNNDNPNYNMSTDINYVGEEYGSYVPKRAVYRTLSGAFDSIIIGNGIFDELDLSININKPYSSDIPQKDISSVLFVRFDHDIENDAPTGYTKATLQRKDDSIITWFNLSDIEISSDVPTEIEYNDYIIPSGIKQTYGLTLYQGETPSDIYTIDIVPKWGRVFLSDNSESYRLNYAVIYSNGVQNIQNGVLMPIAATYPTVIQNAEGNYKSGSLQFKVLGYQFEIDRTLDRNSIVQQTNDILEFLTNKKPKCIKDYNGNIFICRVINSPQISYDANWGNGITTISFDWVEQAKYDKYEEMVEMDIIDNTIPDPILPPTPVPPTPPIPPTPPTPTPIEPFIEKVYLPNGNDPNIIYPTQGIYEYDMYFGEQGYVNVADFYMPTDDYNIISYKMNNVSQTIPQKQHVGDNYIYNLYFKESPNNTDNGKIDIIVKDENNNTISYTFNFIYATSSDYITSSKYYVKDTNTFLTLMNTQENEEIKFNKKYEGEAYGTAIYANGDTGSEFIGFLFISDDLNSAKIILQLTDYDTGESTTIDYEDYFNFHTCEFMDKTWYIAGGDMYYGSNKDNTTVTPSDLIFRPDVPDNENWSYYGYNFLQHIYNYFPPASYDTSSQYYVNNNSTLITGIDNNNRYTFSLNKKNNGSAYFAMADFYLSGGHYISPILISDNPQSVEYTAIITRDGNVQVFDFAYTATYMYDNKVWYITNISPYSYQISLLTAHEKLFYPDNQPYNSTDMRLICSNLLYHIYEEKAPIGITVTPINDVQTWLKCANIWGTNYTQISEIANESNVINAVFASNNASDYLARSNDSNWKTYICGNSTAMSAIGKNDYCANLLLSNNDWRNAICNSEYYDSVLNIRVPQMTSNTTPSGECYCYPSNSNSAWVIFSWQDIPTYILSSSNELMSENYVSYKFDQPVCVNMVSWYTDSANINNVTIKIQASNDNINWTDLYIDNNFIGYGRQPNFANTNKYLYYRMWFDRALTKITNSGQDLYQTGVHYLQFIGRD